MSVLQEQRVLYIPNLYRKEVIECLHSECGHYGVTKTDNMHRFVAKVIRSCLLCAQTNTPHRKCRGLMGHVLATEPLEIVCVDLFGLLPTGRGGVEYIFVLMDVFTKFVKLFLIKKATAHVVTEKVLDCYVLEEGQPKKIISDNGPQFCSDKWKT
ncbi:hypothetical protein PR048_023521 [Dryococelus australis]|uniref:Integrase catalytic domain-containing protein n=1 Tax=Dryococelus australis TaxID=614101 RepID=A0ABQ9GUC6_9NEOP|nr:hypothetical protein PR048_023521 [Dryococelus australis]